MNQFEIEIPNEKKKTYNIVTFIILTLNFVGFGYVLIQTSGYFSLIATIGLLLHAIAWFYYLLNKKHISSPNIEISIILNAILWLFFGNIWLGVFQIFFGIFGFFANKPTIIKFSNVGIYYPSFPVKKYTWQQLNQVILKDNVLSLDFENNTFLQFELGKTIAEKFDTISFNTFCKNHVTKNK
ncbi:MAG: hypothetical protein HOO89_05230 [Ferruginibacter sp.]|nr:hypothetical protein [Ferruginibacter sp.]